VSRRANLSAGGGQGRRLRVVSVIGTRPEAIKLAPVIKALEDHRADIDSFVVSTAQHREMLDQVLAIFQITPSYDLDLMLPDQSLSQVTVRTLRAMERVLKSMSPDLLIVQGDTTTTFAASLAALYCKIPVAHVEAGLRSFERFNPYPEEMNRRLTTVLTDYHFAPTPLAESNLIREGVVPERIFVTGNTVVDALAMMAARELRFHVDGLDRIDFRRERVILVTAHRRENWGEPLRNICAALAELVRKYDDLAVVYPVHMNPNVRRTVSNSLRGLDRIHLIEPVDYLTFIGLMKRAYLILTDSGGIQEEAPSLGKPVLVLRTVTERPEASLGGMAMVIGTKVDDIVTNVARLLDDRELRERMSRGSNPYGDGQAARRIVSTIRRLFGLERHGPN